MVTLRGCALTFRSFGLTVQTGHVTAPLLFALARCAYFWAQVWLRSPRALQFSVSRWMGL